MTKRNPIAIFRSFLTSERGNGAMLFALALPVLAVAGFGALDFATVLRGKTFLQGVADAAALQGATQLGFDQSSATAQRTIRNAETQAHALGDTWALTATAQADLQAGSMTVGIDANRASLAGNLIRPGRWQVHVTSTAIMNARRPLCVLATDTQQHDLIHVQDRSNLTSPACLIQSDDDITVDNGAAITAGDVHAVSSTKGSISPAALTNAPAVADPFINLPIDIPTVCQDTDKLKYTAGTQSLNPGVHCGDVAIGGTATLILNPGEHYFIKGNFHLKGSAQLIGSDVTLIFKAQYSLKFDQNSTMSLEGRKTGPYAGFVLVASRQYNGQFEIATDRARQLLGTIYLPNATLAVNGFNNTVADQSPWTVIVAKSVQVQGSANLVVNANYSSSTVPVPTGVGNSARSVRLN